MRSVCRTMAWGSGLALCVLASGCSETTRHMRYIDDGPIAAVSTVPTLAANTAHMPKVMLLIDEKSLGTIPTSEAEAMATDLLLARKVPVVDQDMVRANINKGQQLLRLAGDEKSATALGLQYGADIIIVGEAVAKPSARRLGDSNVRAYQAVATLRAVRTDSGVTIASCSEDASIPAIDDVSGSSKALKAASRKSLDRLIPAMLEAWSKNAITGASAPLNQISISVGGVDAAWKLKAVRDCLRGMAPTIASVVQRSYIAGMAVFDVESAAPAEKLSEELVMKPPQNLKLQVLEVGTGKMDLRAVAVPPPAAGP